MKNMIGRIQRLYQYVTHHLSSALLTVSVLFFLGCIVMYLTFRENEAQVMLLMERMVYLFPEKSATVFTTISFSTAFVRNIELVGLLVLLGCIPFVFGSALILLGCSAMIGIAGAYYHAGDVALRVFLTSLLPHGIVQIPCLLVAGALGVRLCTQITKKVLGRNSTWYWQKEILYIIKVFLWILVPLVLLSSFLETSLTPFILRHFGW